MLEDSSLAALFCLYNYHMLKRRIFLLLIILTFPVFTFAATFTKPLSQGMQSDDVKTLQQYLKDHGYLVGWQATGLYGQATADAVAQFQTDNGLEPVGSVGPKTFALLNGGSSATSDSSSASSQGTTMSRAELIASLLAQVKVLQAQLAALLAAKNGQTAPACSSLTFTRALDIGARGTDVSDLQTFLQARGYLSGDSITGYFGPLTSAAVKAFQKENGIEAIGTVGPKTRAQIASLSTVCTSAQSSDGASTASTTPLSNSDALSSFATTSTTTAPLLFPGYGGGGDGGFKYESYAVTQAAPAVSTATPGSGSLIDAASNIWTVTAAGVIMENGAPAGYSANVILLLYYNGQIYQENGAGGWWRWTGIPGALWDTLSGDPRNETSSSGSVSSPSASSPSVVLRSITNNFGTYNLSDGTKGPFWSGQGIWAPYTATYSGLSLTTGSKTVTGFHVHYRYPAQDVHLYVA